MRALALGAAFLLSFAVMWFCGTLFLWAVGAPDGATKLSASDVPGFAWEELLHAFSRTAPQRRMAVAAAALLALAQVAFVSPLVGPLRLAPTGASMRWTVIGAAVLVGSMTYLIGWAIVHAAEVLAAGPRPEFGVSDAGVAAIWWISPLVLFPGWFVCGALWTWIMRRAIASRDPDTVSRLSRRLLAGTCIELVLALPLYLLVRKRTDCVCAISSFWSIVIGLLGLVWLCGPAGVLLLTQDARREWRKGACGRCGYPLRAGSARCSECGHALGG
jgi:hypothetical protein